MKKWSGIKTAEVFQYIFTWQKRVVVRVVQYEKIPVGESCSRWALISRRRCAMLSDRFKEGLYTIPLSSSIMNGDVSETVFRINNNNPKCIKQSEKLLNGAVGTNVCCSHPQGMRRSGPPSSYPASSSSVDHSPGSLLEYLGAACNGAATNKTTTRFFSFYKVEAVIWCLITS